MKDPFVEIKVLTMGEYDRLIQLWNETEGMGLRSLDDSREGIERFILRNPETSFICLADKELIAAILCGHDGRRGYIYHAAVKSSYRGRGVGRKLVERTLQALKDEGINKASLVVFNNNTQGNGFWEALGFRQRRDLIYRDLSLNPENL